MPNQNGVVKIMPAKEIQKSPAPFPDADAALRCLRRIVAESTGDRSRSADWPKITRCFRRDTTLAIDARDTGLEASISFNISAKTQNGTYTLKTPATRGMEKGLVEQVEILDDPALQEASWKHSEAYALAAYPYRFVVFTRADNHARISRVWLIGISEFSTTSVDQSEV